MTDVFLSYVREDRARAAELATALTRLGWFVWWDRRIPPGRSFEEVIGEQLETARCVVVLWSRESVRSDWVKDEAQVAKERAVLVQVMIEAVKPPMGFRTYMIADLVNGRLEPGDPDFDLLVQGIERFVPTRSVLVVSSDKEPHGEAARRSVAVSDEHKEGVGAGSTWHRDQGESIVTVSVTKEVEVKEVKEEVSERQRERELRPDEDLVAPPNEGPPPIEGPSVDGDGPSIVVLAFFGILAALVAILISFIRNF